MSNINLTLSEYAKRAMHIENIKSHLKHFRDSVVETGAPSDIADATVHFNDVDKYIKCCEQDLKESCIVGVPKPEPLDSFKHWEQERAYSVSSLPSVLRDAVEAIAEYVQAPLGLSAHAVLSAITHIAQVRANAVSPINEPMPCSLFILSLGDSGSRKSTCHRLAFKVINECEREARIKYQQEKIKSADKTKARIGTAEGIVPFDLDPQETMSDVVFEGLVGHMIKGCSFLTVDSDDAAQWFGGHSLTSTTRLATCAGYTKAFDNGFFERNRSISNINGSGFAYNRRLSVSLMAQDAVIKKYILDPDLQAQGLLPRFIFSTSASIAGTRFVSHESLVNQEIADPRLVRFWERCKSRILIPPKINPKTREVEPPTYFLDNSALKLWIDSYNWLERQQGLGGDYEHIPAFASRGGELMRRLATVIAFFDEKDHVDAMSMRAAIDVVLNSIHEWSKYTQYENQKSDTELATDMLKRLSAIELRCFDKRTMQQRGPAYARKSAAVCTRLLSVLLTHKYVFAPEETGEKYYLINPHYLRSQGAG